MNSWPCARSESCTYATLSSYCLPYSPPDSTLIASIIRLPYLHGLNQSKDPTCETHLRDFHHFLLTCKTGDVVNIASWSIAELGSAITLSSVPAIRPLFAHYFPNFLGSMIKSSRGAAGSNQTTPSSGTSRTKRVNPYHISETVTNPATQPRWFSYTELDDIDDGLRKNSTRDMESQGYILQSGGRGGVPNRK